MQWLWNSVWWINSWISTEFVRNVKIFEVDNSSSPHADNSKNILLVLGEGATDDINSSIGAAEEKFSIDFSKAQTKFYLSLHYNVDDSYLLVNGKLKADNKNVNFPFQFCLGNISYEFDCVKGRRGIFKRKYLWFIWNIHKYLMIKNNVK